jgi:hypothetical protein
VEDLEWIPNTNYQYLNICASFNPSPTPDYVPSLMLLKSIEPGSPDGPKHLAISYERTVEDLGWIQTYKNHYQYLNVCASLNSSPTPDNVF